MKKIEKNGIDKIWQRGGLLRKLNQKENNKMEEKTGGKLKTTQMTTWKTNEGHNLHQMEDKVLNKWISGQMQGK